MIWTALLLHNDPDCGQLAGFDPASNKRYERQLHAGCRGVVYGSGPSGSGAGYDSLDRLVAWRRGLPAPGGGRVASPLGLASGDAVMSVRVGR